jgi:hypothetical protein
MTDNRFIVRILAQRYLDTSITFRLGGMLKSPPASFSARKNPQRTPKGTPPVLAPPAALLDGLFEHPAV